MDLYNLKHKVSNNIQQWKDEKEQLNSSYNLSISYK